jgi:glycosyltransferase involved in cell wall biosynthesis
MPEIDCYVVGGSAEQFREVTGVSHVPDNLHIVGECKSKDVPHWLLAADVLLILGTKKNEQSFRYTAPMKVYEYMASERPIVASGTPALRSIIGDGEALFYEPDNAGDLAAQVRAVVGRSRDTGAMIVSAARAAREHSWQKRAARILSHMERI